jgi:hypothetical protein
MALSGKQREWCLKNLSTGQFAVKITHESFREPFLIRAPRLKGLPRVSERDIAAAASRLLADLLPPEPTMPDTGRGPAAEGGHEQTSGGATASALSTDERALLESVREHPFAFLTAHYETSLLGARRGGQAKRQLIARGLAREHRIDTGRAGQRPLLLETTVAGWQAWGAESPPWAATCGAPRALGRARLPSLLSGDGSEADTAAWDAAWDLIARRGAERLVVLVCADPFPLGARLAKAAHAGFTAGLLFAVTPCLREARRIVSASSFASSMVSSRMSLPESNLR